VVVDRGGLAVLPLHWVLAGLVAVAAGFWTSRSRHLSLVRLKAIRLLPAYPVRLQRARAVLKVTQPLSQLVLVVQPYQPMAGAVEAAEQEAMLAAEAARVYLVLEVMEPVPLPGLEGRITGLLAVQRQRQ
jgi:hypothetical protein